MVHTRQTLLPYLVHLLSLDLSLLQLLCKLFHSGSELDIILLKCLDQDILVALGIQGPMNELFHLLILLPDSGEGKRFTNVIELLILNLKRLLQVPDLFTKRWKFNVLPSKKINVLLISATINQCLRSQFYWSNGWGIGSLPRNTFDWPRDCEFEPAGDWWFSYTFGVHRTVIPSIYLAFGTLSCGIALGICFNCFCWECVRSIRR